MSWEKKLVQVETESSYDVVVEGITNKNDALLVELTDVIKNFNVIIQFCEAVEYADILEEDTLSKNQIKALRIELKSKKSEIGYAARELKELHASAKKTQYMLAVARKKRQEENAERYKQSLYNKLEDIKKQVESIKTANTRMQEIKKEFKEKSPSLFKSLKKAGSFLGKTALAVGAVAIAAKIASSYVKDKKDSAWEFMKKTAEW